MSGPNETRATSRTRIGVPPGPTATTLASTSARPDVAAPAQHVLGARGLEHTRADLDCWRRRTARLTSPTDRPNATRRSGSTMIWYWRSKPPSVATSATPSTAWSAGRTVNSWSVAELREVERPGRVLDHVLVDPADAGGVRAELRDDTRGQRTRGKSSVTRERAQ
jgi:hypothetical protein